VEKWSTTAVDIAFPSQFPPHSKGELCKEADEQTMNCNLNRRRRWRTTIVIEADLISTSVARPLNLFSIEQQLISKKLYFRSTVSVFRDLCFI